jgi:hypothetical protein
MLPNKFKKKQTKVKHACSEGNESLLHIINLKKSHDDNLARKAIIIIYVVVAKRL